MRKTESGPFTVGRDHVVPQEDGTLLVFSKEPKDETWRLRKFRKTRVVVRGEAFYIAQIRDGGGACDLVYVLAPWPKDTSDLAGATVHYDEDYICALGETHERARERRRIGQGMLLLAPLLGFAQERTKRRWEKELEVPARVLTLYSCYLEGGVGFTVMVLATIWILSGHPAFLFPLLWQLSGGFLVTLDAIARYLYVGPLGPRYYGFLEYVFKREPLSVSVPEQPMKTPSPDSDEPSGAKEEPPEENPTAPS
ncbi:MAG: hypothetical protein JSV08_03940 [Acidobacteriota bacterium]|nr:MAG: hypothetical protein JSV08_03940 [Acidobacteriota bacterium]